MTEPQAPAAVKVKDRVVSLPPAISVPYDCPPLGVVIPFVASSVAKTLVASIEPTFLTERSIVTVSSGSTAPLVGAQLSADSEAASGEITGVGTSTPL